MKRYLFGTAIAMSALMPLAFAQDSCCPVDCDPCCYNQGFDGFYIGGNIGVFTHTAHRNDLDGFLTDNSGWTSNDTSFTAGLQLGYDWQCCNSLFGLVVDWNWVDTDRKIHDDPNGTTEDNYLRNEANWFTTIRARAGLTLCDALVYVTGGAVVTRYHTRWQNEPNTFNDHHTRWGWTGGFGAEFLVWCNWSIGVEFLFMQFSQHTRTFSGSTGTFSFAHSDSAWLGRILLNYRFGDLCSCW